MMSIPSEVIAAAAAPTKAFFRFDDGAASYWVVATDAEHARRIMKETEIESANGTTLDEGIKCGEILVCEVSGALMVHDEGQRRPLASCDVGDWFCSEY